MFSILSDPALLAFVQLATHASMYFLHVRRSYLCQSLEAGRLGESASHQHSQPGQASKE